MSVHAESRTLYEEKSIVLENKLEYRRGSYSMLWKSVFEWNVIAIFPRAPWVFFFIRYGVEYDKKKVNLSNYSFGGLGNFDRKWMNVSK